MAKTNGNGGSGDISFKMLEQLEKLNAGMSALTVRVDALGTNLGSRLERVELRLDKVVENTGSHWRQLERRLSALERRSR